MDLRLNVQFSNVLVLIIVPFYFYHVIGHLLINEVNIYVSISNVNN